MPVRPRPPEPPNLSLFAGGRLVAWMDRTGRVPRHMRVTVKVETSEAPLPPPEEATQAGFLVDAAGGPSYGPDQVDGTRRFVRETP